MKVVMANGVLVDDSAEAVVGTSDGSVNERELSDIILVDHAQDGLLLDAVHLGVLDFGLSCRLLFVETVGRNKLSRIVLRQTMQSVQRLGQTRRGKAVDIGLEISSLNNDKKQNKLQSLVHQ